MLIVFLNNYIIFEDVEKSIYNEFMEIELKEDVMKTDARLIVWKFLKRNYLRKMHKNETVSARMLINLDLLYMAKRYRVLRLEYMRQDVDLDIVLNKIKDNIYQGMMPLKNELDEYYIQTIRKEDYANLKESSSLADSFLKNAKQTCNLVKVLRQDKCLEGLTTINEVYDAQVNFLEEVIHHHNVEHKGKEKDNILTEQSSQLGDEKDFDFNQVFMTQNVIDKN